MACFIFCLCVVISKIEGYTGLLLDRILLGKYLYDSKLLAVDGLL